jgi:hypothetical protein
VAAVCPIDLSAEIEGRPARGGIIRPVPDLAGRPDWPEAFYLLARKTRHSYTLEAPSDFPLATRMTALVTAVGALLAGVDAITADRPRWLREKLRAARQSRKPRFGSLPRPPPQRKGR